MHRALRIALASAASVALGIGSAAAALHVGRGEIARGPWRTSFLTGRAEADMYTRARVAIGGLLALAPSQTVYWNADVDDGGEPLDARCAYRVEGVELPARWWSLTAYGPDHFLIPNEPGRYSWSRTTLARDPGGPWVVRVSTEPRAGNWLPSGKPKATGRFALTLRLYNPEPVVVQRPEGFALPHIIREDCR